MPDKFILCCGIAVASFALLGMTLSFVEYLKPHKQRDHKFLKDNIFPIIVSLIVAIMCFYMAYNLDLSPQGHINSQCEKNMSMCVLDNEKCPEGYINPGSISSICYNEVSMKSINTIKNYRFKTDCEKNPREDADCKCRENHLHTESTIIKYPGNEPFEINIKEVCSSARDRTPTERCDYQNGTLKKLIFEDRTEEVCEVIE